MTDVALCSMRGCTVHGHSLRLEENGMMFDMLSRTEMGKDGNVYVLKDQVGIPLDKKINLGRPCPRLRPRRGPRFSEFLVLLSAKNIQAVSSRAP